MDTSSWKPLLRRPEPRDHLIQLYTDEAFLAAAVTHFLGSGLAEGEAAVIIATPEHVELFTRGLTAQGFDVRGLAKHDRLVVLDARDTLAKFMVDGMPEPTTFLSLITGILDRIRAAGHADVRLYGEMVNLLWNHNLEATVQLEALWNEVLAERGVSLLCAYGMDAFDARAYGGVLHRICRSHSYLIPVDDYERFDHAVDRAFADVFGRDDAGRLRELMASRNGSTARMPAAQAALFALRDLPASVGEAVLDRTRHHYGNGGNGKNGAEPTAPNSR